MKNLLIFLAIFSLFCTSVLAKDYTKLQVKEMKHAQKYGTTQKYFDQQPIARADLNVTNSSIKDPKIMKFSEYEKINDKDYNKKIKADDVEYKNYESYLKSKAKYNYNAKSKSDDYYNIYRVTEKLIRANNLDYLNWRVGIERNTEEVNAYNTGMNYICLNTALVDTFSGNDDALAIIIGHEMAHALLGHSQRKAQLYNKLDAMTRAAKGGNTSAGIVGIGMEIKYNADSKNMEYAADVEGVKLAMHAGYDINAIYDIMGYFKSLPYTGSEWTKTHPHPGRRIQNVKDNAKYFPKEWEDVGKYNIYHSEVMPVKLSSDRKSIVITAPSSKLNPNQYYSPETMEELYARLGYMSYINGEFSKSLKYFDDLFSTDKTNAPAYLYASYASEYLYNNTKENKYKKLAKDYAEQAYKLDPKNKYIKEQVDSL